MANQAGGPVLRALIEVRPMFLCVVMRDTGAFSTYLPRIGTDLGT